MVRYTSLRKYKRHLLRELVHVDEETKACAVFDAKEHLNLMVKDILMRNRKIGRRAAFHMAVETFGYPTEIAEAYCSVM